MYDAGMARTQRIEDLHSKLEFDFERNGGHGFSDYINKLREKKR